MIMQIVMDFALFRVLKIFEILSLSFIAGCENFFGGFSNKKTGKFGNSLYLTIICVFFIMHIYIPLSNGTFAR